MCTRHDENTTTHGCTALAEVPNHAATLGKNLCQQASLRWSLQRWFIQNSKCELQLHRHARPPPCALCIELLQEVQCHVASQTDGSDGQDGGGGGDDVDDDDNDGGGGDNGNDDDDHGDDLPGLVSASSLILILSSEPSTHVLNGCIWLFAVVLLPSPVFSPVRTLIGTSW